MAQQEEGWPLGLQPMNVRAGIARNRELSLSHSFNTLLSASSISSLDSSSDLDTESTGSFFHEKSTSLGSLIGVSNVLKLSRRSTRRTTETIRNKKNSKTKIWFFSLCPRISTDAVSTDNTVPSLGHFLEAERRVRRNPGPNIACGPDDFYQISDPNSLFVGGRIAPPQTGEPASSKTLISHENGEEPSMFISCLCANLAHC